MTCKVDQLVALINTLDQRRKQAEASKEEVLAAMFDERMAVLDRFPEIEVGDFTFRAGATGHLEIRSGQEEEVVGGIAKDQVVRLASWILDNWEDRDSSKRRES